MRYLILALFFVTAIKANGQVQNEIDKQVWKPFIEAYNRHRSEEFLALHSKDLIRSPRDAKQVLNWEQYLKETKASDKQDIEEKIKRVLELRFTERLDNSIQAIEVGVYKSTYQFANGTSQVFYGRFHVALKKEKGFWKIVVDTDSSENNTIGEKDFLAAKPMK